MLKLATQKNVTLDGKEYKNYYLQYKGIKVQIKPSFVEDYDKLKMLAVILNDND